MLLASSPRARRRRQGPWFRPPMSHDGWALECEPTSQSQARYGVNRGRSTRRQRARPGGASGTVSGSRRLRLFPRYEATGSQTEGTCMYTSCTSITVPEQAPRTVPAAPGAFPVCRATAASHGMSCQRKKKKRLDSCVVVVVVRKSKSTATVLSGLEIAPAKTGLVPAHGRTRVGCQKPANSAVPVRRYGAPPSAALLLNTRQVLSHQRRARGKPAPSCPIGCSPTGPRYG